MLLIVLPICRCRFPFSRPAISLVLCAPLSTRLSSTTRRIYSLMLTVRRPARSDNRSQEFETKRRLLVWAVRFSLPAQDSAGKQPTRHQTPETRSPSHAWIHGQSPSPPHYWYSLHSRLH